MSDEAFPSSDICHLTSVSGFTLVEMAIVLIVIGLIVATIYPALNVMRNGAQAAATQANLRALMQATAAYLQANGCLPCPTPAGTIGAGFGHVRGDTNTAACINLNAAGKSALTCPAADGIAPFMSLGVPASTARDGWGYWITMRIDPDLAVLPYAGIPASSFVPPTAACTQSDVSNGVCAAAQLGLNEKGYCRTNLGTVQGIANRVSIQTLDGNTQQAAVIFVSHGARGYGSFVASASSFYAYALNGCQLPFPEAGSAACAVPACPASGPSSCNPAVEPDCYAQCNAAGTNQFVDAPQADAYSDILAYAGLNALAGMLGTGACTQGW